MATHKIFIGNYSVTKHKVGNARTTEYSYDSEEQILEIFWRDECIFSKSNVEPGDAFIVACNGDKPKVDIMHLPFRLDDSTMFLLGFDSGKRRHNKRAFGSTLGQNRIKLAAGDREEYYFDGKHYEFRYLKDSKGRIYHLAALIEKGITKSEYYEILTEWPYDIRYPRYFVKKLLVTRFNFSDKEIREIFKIWDS